MNQMLDRKQLIITTAKRIFSEKGYAATGLREIAESAGVSIGNIYNYFKNKEEIFTQIMDPQVILESLKDVPHLLKENFPFNLNKLILILKNIVDNNNELSRLIFIDLIEFGGSHTNHTLKQFFDFAKTTFEENVINSDVNLTIKDLDLNFYIKSYIITIVSFFLISNILPAASIKNYSNEEISNLLADVILHGIVKK